MEMRPWIFRFHHFQGVLAAMCRLELQQPGMLLELHVLFQRQLRVQR